MAEGVDVRATHRYLPMSPQKVRLVLDLIRGTDVLEAMQTLDFTQKAAARPVAKLLRSAVANAEQNYGMSAPDLYVHRVYADDGPTRRWRRFGARLRFKPILKRQSHVTVILRQREPTQETVVE